MVYSLQLWLQQEGIDATAFDGTKKSSISDKGVVNNAISSHLLALLEKGGINTHFVEQLELYDVQVTLATPFPGTPFYKRLLKQGRLMQERPW